MRLCSITPGYAGEVGLRLYEIDHSAGSRYRRSSAVTRPLVTSLIFRIAGADGARRPLTQRLTEAPETPTIAPNLACDMLCSDRNSASFMTIHYHRGKESQDQITHSVTDFKAGFHYLYGMNIGLDLLVTEYCDREDVSAAELARRARLPSERLSEYRKGKRSISIKHAVSLATLFGVTPFDIDPDYAKELLDTIPNKERREIYRSGLKQIYQLQNLERQTGS
jgi:transcriptional regulator with XRE-family HTH domain